MEPKTVALTSPIKDFGKELSEVTISREANGKDLLAVENMTPERSTMMYISRLCGISFQAVESMTIRDIAAVEEAMAPFVGAGPQTGEPSSAD